MLFDAIRAELWRFFHNTSAVFWGLFFIPLSSLVVGIFWRTYLDSKIMSVRDNLPAGLLAPPSVNIGDKITEKAAILAEPGLMVFFIIAAAAIFATDYRWETWRLVRARNSRENLIIGKILAVGALALITMLSLLLAEAVGYIVSAFIEQNQIIIGFKVDQFGATLMMILIAWVRIVQFAMLSLAVALLTRSLAAAIIVPIALGFGAFMLQKMSGYFGWHPTDWSTMLAFPPAAYDQIQSALLGAEIGKPILVRAATGLLVWLAMPIAFALWFFPQQDLSKE